MKITIYELLGLIKDGKAPKKIKWNDVIWEYINLEMDYMSLKSADLFFYDEWRITTHLCDEVEIIEEEDKEIKKLVINEKFLFSNSHSGNMRKEDRRLLDSNFKEIAFKINELIDEINKLKRGN